MARQSQVLSPLCLRVCVFDLGRAASRWMHEGWLNAADELKGNMCFRVDTELSIPESQRQEVTTQVSTFAAETERGCQATGRGMPGQDLCVQDHRAQLCGSLGFSHPCFIFLSFPKVTKIQEAKAFPMKADEIWNHSYESGVGLRGSHISAPVSSTEAGHADPRGSGLTVSHCP